MAQHFPRHHHSPEPWLCRLDRAADGMNPFLTTLAIGLVILNLTCLALLAAHLEVSRISPDVSACPSSLASGPGTTLPPTGDVRAWTSY
jgi:hypothetical protein